MSYWERAHTEECEGFTIVLETEFCQDPPDWDFESEEDKQNTLDKIDNGEWQYFNAKVYASKAGIEFPADYLCGCCYASVAEFVKNNDYYADLKASALQYARDAIAELIKP